MLPTQEDFTATLQTLYLAAAQEGVEKAKIERVTAEMTKTNLEASYRECRRPWRLLGAVVMPDDDRRWSCTFQGVTAYGDTPEIACDNFDHLWTFGEYKP